MKTTESLQTANVIERDTDGIMSVVSYPDTKNGNGNAEVRFINLIRKHLSEFCNSDEVEDQVNSYINDWMESGFYTDYEGYVISIVHSCDDSDTNP